MATVSEDMGNIAKDNAGEAKALIQPRRMSFKLDENMDKYWFRGNPLITTFFYGLSATFPDGERFFIHSVRHYQPAIHDEQLKERVKGFIGQEAHHGHSHEAFNQLIQDLGFPMDRILTRVQNHIGRIKRAFKPKYQLALTVAAEHLTATMAESILTRPDLLESIEPEFRKMLIWHAIEEIEHKSVAADVFRTQVNDEYVRRRGYIAFVLVFFFRIALYQFMMLKQDKRVPSPIEVWQAFTFFWGPKGMMIEMLPALIKNLKIGFHPDDIDQEALVSDWEDRYPEVADRQV